MRVPWTSMRSNQSILKEINLEYAKAPILWAPDVKSQLTGKTLILGKIEGKGETETEDKMVGWHHRLNGHGIGWTPGVGDGQGRLACCGLWGRKESDMTEQLN